MVTWVTWARGSVGEWVKIFFTWVNMLRGLCGSNIFLRGSIFFCVGQLLFTRRDYFTILQLIASRTFSRIPCQKILFKPCLTSLVFLTSLIPKVDLGPLQRFRWRLLWHYVKADYPLNKELCLEVEWSYITLWML